MNLILLVDDDEITRLIIRRILEGAGYAVIEACDGDEAIERYDDHKPDLVITDIFMPKKNGLESIVEIREKNDNAKIIAISAGGQVGHENYLETAMTLGACDAIAKPVGKERLLAAIHDAFSSD